MRKLFGILALAFSASTLAQTQNWQISEISGQYGVVGYIYHSSAVGTQIGTSTEKSVTGLRLVCSTIGDTSAGPAIVIYWNGMFGNKPATIEAKVDGKEVLTGQWNQDGPIMFRNIGETTELIKALKSGRTVVFTWYDNGEKRTTGFNLRGFNQHLSEFNTSCKTQL